MNKNFLTAFLVGVAIAFPSLCSAVVPPDSISVPEPATGLLFLAAAGAGAAVTAFKRLR